MSEQYFTQNPQSKSNPKTWTYELRNQVLTFTSDTGVFSKRTVDFGSQTLIESFILPEADGAIVDLGCGYGPIGLSIAKAFPNRQIVMGDINERAVELAEENKERNNVTNARVFLSDQFSQLPNEPYAAVLTNPPIRVGKKIVHSMFEQAHRHLCENGELWVVIQKKQGAPSAIKKMASLFTKVDVVRKEKGYFIVRAIK